MADRYQSRDVMVYLGKVAEWLASAPETEPEYGGSFHVSHVKIMYASGGSSSDEIGTFTNDDPDWLYRDGIDE